MPVSASDYLVLCTNQVTGAGAAVASLSSIGSALGWGATPTWGSITGALSSQSDLQAALDAKGTSNFDGIYSSLTGKPTLGTLSSQNGTFSGTSSGTNTGDQNLAPYATLASPIFTGTVTLPSGQALVAPALGTPASGNLANCTFPTLNQNTTGSAAILTTARTINGVSFNGSANITVTAAGSTLSDPVTFANGANTGSAATSATTGSMTVNMTTSVITITPTNACTFNASGGVTGQLVTFIITTSGVSSFVLTFGINFKSTGALATGTTTAKVFAVTFRCSNGTQWVEIARTIAQ